jgi:hypothetical protein
LKRTGPTSSSSEIQGTRWQLSNNATFRVGAALFLFIRLKLLEVLPSRRIIRLTTPTSSNSNAIPFYPNIRNLNGSAYFKGFHVGAVTNLSSGSAGTWRWTNSPTGPLNGRGFFDTNVSYAGTGGGLAISGTNVFFAYKGEGWLSGSSQANQLFHYSTKDGTFLGQFGLPKIPGERNRPGAAGNIYSLSVVKVNGVTYVYTPDEGSHGIHRWRINE